MSNLPVAEKAKEKLNGTTGKHPVPKTMTGLKSSQVKDVFEMYRAQIAQAVPKTVTPDRLIQVATTMISRNSSLAKCTTSSLIGALMQSAILGLDPSPALQYCYFIPFFNSKNKQSEIQFLIGYRGLLQLLRRTGEVKSVSAYAVYENDIFGYSLGLEPKINHVPTLEERGKIKYVYAVINFKDGGVQFEVMNASDIESIKKRSQSAKSEYSPWKTDEAEMWKKTVLRRVCKLAPMAIEPAKALQLEKEISVDEKKLDAENFNVDSGEIEPEDVPFVESETEEKLSPFIMKATEICDKITAAASKELWINELGSIGYESIDQVEPENYQNVISAFEAILKELQK